MRYGIYSHSALQFYPSNFRALPGTQSCCAGFDGGDGTGFAAGMLAEIPINGPLYFSLRAGIMSYPYYLSQIAPTRIIINGNGTDGAFEHSLKGSFTGIELMPGFRYRLFDNLYADAGIQFAFAGNSSFEQKDQIIQPANAGTFLDSNGIDTRKRVRNEYTGTLDAINTRIAPYAGMSYELPMNKRSTLFLVPEIFWQMSLNRIIDQVDWKNNTLRMGISLKYSPRPLPIRYDTVYRVDTLWKNARIVRLYTITGQSDTAISIQEKQDTLFKNYLISRTDTVFRPEIPLLQADISIKGVDSSGKEIDIAVLKTEEILSTEYIPLVSYVFFQHGSDIIEPQYKLLSKQEVKQFNPDKKVGDRLQTYYHILNIIGYRLQLYPKATITIIGCTDEQDIEKGNRELSKQRALRLKQYLVDSWQINPSRILVKASLLPQKPAISGTDPAIAENRRAEFISDTYQILAPVIVRDTTILSDPPIIRFIPQVKAQAGIKDWSLHLLQKQKSLTKMNGDTAIPNSLDWKPDRNTLPELPGSVDIRLNVQDNIGQTVSDSGSLKLDMLTLRRRKIEKIGNRMIEKYSLVLFETGRAELTPLNKSILDEIRQKLIPDARLTIISYTDKLGNTLLNQQLAAGRAKNVQAYLGHKAQIIEKPNTDLFNPDLPEGRFYSRTVDIILDLPLENE